GMSAVRTARREAAVRVAVADARTSHGKTFVIQTDAQGASTRTSTGRKARPARAEDLDGVLFQWDIAGDFCFTDTEAWDSAIENARSQVTHDLRLAAPPARETIRERLVKNWEPEENTKLLEGTKAVRLNLHLELTRGTYRELAEADRAVRATERSEGLARILAIVVVALGAVAGYIRLDEFTKGYYTGRL